MSYKKKKKRSIALTKFSSAHLGIENLKGGKLDVTKETGRYCTSIATWPGSARVLSRWSDVRARHSVQYACCDHPGSVL